MTLLEATRRRTPAAHLPTGRTFAVLAAFALAIFAGLLYCRPAARVHAAAKAAAPAAAHAAAHASRIPIAKIPARPFHPTSTPVLVELFTSEGCSSCPSADALLARLQREQPVPDTAILVLEEHVDYWDSLGWRDRFSSHQFTARQSAYEQRLRLAGEYTPQMIVDGTDEFAGNDIVHALHSIAQASRTPKLALTLSPLVVGVGDARVAGVVSILRRPRSGTRSRALPRADIYAAVVESVASTQVLRGENGGQTLHHVSVVREMHRIGSLARASSSRLKFSLGMPADTAGLEGLRVVVFIQRAGQGAVLGAVSSAPASAPALAASIAAAPTSLGERSPR